jgi:hypothetical protein
MRGAACRRTNLMSDASAANDDALNIYLAVYCRRLNPTLRIVCRITQT